MYNYPTLIMENMNNVFATIDYMMSSDGEPTLSTAINFCHNLPHDLPEFLALIALARTSDLANKEGLDDETRYDILFNIKTKIFSKYPNLNSSNVNSSNASSTATPRAPDASCG
uniref:Uncharacterized protein n=1 Tax=Megaviridae environmental sample TaxID=1737588 RepID=A0A5J6VIZ0_9VIRU|nr:MAG: hypothetical protein [Megaviridae environmental sample]